MSSPFIPDVEWLEARVRRYVDHERARQDQMHGGQEHDRGLDLVEWLARIDMQRGQLAELLVAGGRFRSHSREKAVRQLVQISALARRAAVFQLAEELEAHGEHVEDRIGEQFAPQRERVTAEVRDAGQAMTPDRATVAGEDFR